MPCGKKKRKVRRFALLACLLMLAAPIGAELRFTSISATSTSQTIGLPAGAKALTLVNDGANTAYVRVFSSGELPAASTTAYAPIKINEGFEFKHPQNLDIVALSIVCDTAETATVRMYYW